MKFLDKLQPLGLLAMRIALGAVMIVHGYPKVTGIHNVEKFFSSIGLPWWSAYLSAGAEFFGGILIIIGLLTRPVAFAQLIDMIVAVAKVHWKHGLVGEGNYQLPLTLAALALALIVFGAGPIALDAIIGRAAAGAEERPLPQIPEHASSSPATHFGRARSRCSQLAIMKVRLEWRHAEGLQARSISRAAPSMCRPRIWVET